MAFASSGNEDEKGNKKWSELRLPGRVGEQVKARWENILDPSIKKGAWTEDEMAILRSAQKELGNKVSVFVFVYFQLFSIRISNASLIITHSIIHIAVGGDCKAYSWKKRKLSEEPVV